MLSLGQFIYFYDCCQREKGKRAAGECCQAGSIYPGGGAAGGTPTEGAVFLEEGGGSVSFSV